MNKLNYVEFYITNVCNLNCPGCNRFNNNKFHGFQRWNDHEEEYKQWSEELEINRIGILGGEPLLNPDVLNWLVGIRKLWPRQFIKLISNGTYLNKVVGLYKHIRDNNISLEIGIHNKKHRDIIFNNIEQFLVAPLEYNFNNDNMYKEYMLITDSNNVKLRVEYNWWFHQGALLPTENGFTLHKSDVEKAHEICTMAECHHFIRGKIYKCGVAALLPEFAEQHNVILSPDDQELMTSYKPLCITDSEDTKTSFINNLRNSIPQCRFCPEVYHGKQIFAEEKKVKFFK